MRTTRIGLTLLLGAALTAAGTVTVGTGVAAASAAESQIQFDLAGMGYLSFSGVDGADGPTTQGAVKAFQTDRCLGADGVVGIRTHALLAGQVIRVQAAAGATPDGLFGPASKAAVKAYQGAHGLTQNGQADAATMAAMGIDRTMASCAKPTTADMTAAMVRIAQQEKANATRNHERGGYNCNFYTSADGFAGTGGACSSQWTTEEWCADFVMWVWLMAGGDTTGATPAAASFETYGSKHGTWHTSGPQPGDAIVLPGHVGMVISSTSTTVTYISGNTFDSADGQDDIVGQRTINRSGSGIVGYASPVAR